MRCTSPFDNGSYHLGTISTNRTSVLLVLLGQASLSTLRVGKILHPANKMHFSFDNGSYHMGTTRTNRTNRQLGQPSLSIQRVGHILSPPHEMHFSIRQRIVSHGHDSFESTAIAQLFYDSYLLRCIGQPSYFEVTFSLKSPS